MVKGISGGEGTYESVSLSFSPPLVAVEAVGAVRVL